MEDSFIQVKRFLREGRKVLFTGCACQIAGLKRYLKKDDANLICIDLICHGVDSPQIWLDYLHSLFPDESVKSVNFRDKVTGQDNSSVCIISSKSMFCERGETVYTSKIGNMACLRGLHVRFVRSKAIIV
ncbi:MAG: Coenzyme F420 hydrogenase/dehydrogenase, beta subunit C-terminal domain [Bacteroides cellulosilyticus]